VQRKALYKCIELLLILYLVYCMLNFCSYRLFVLIIFFAKHYFVSLHLW